MSIRNHFKTEIIYLYNPDIFFAEYSACYSACHFRGNYAYSNKVQIILRLRAESLFNLDIPFLCNNRRINKIYIILKHRGKETF